MKFVSVIIWMKNFFSFFKLETMSHYVALVGLQSTEICLPLPLPLSDKQNNTNVSWAFSSMFWTKIEERVGKCRTGIGKARKTKSGSVSVSFIKKQTTPKYHLHGESIFLGPVNTVLIPLWTHCGGTGRFDAVPSFWWEGPSF